MGENEPSVEGNPDVVDEANKEADKDKVASGNDDVETTTEATVENGDEVNIDVDVGSTSQNGDTAQEQRGTNDVADKERDEPEAESEEEPTVEETAKESGSGEATESEGEVGEKGRRNSEKNS